MSKSTVDSVVVAYRRAIAGVANPNTNIELELRINNMNYDNFKAVFDKLVESEAVLKTNISQSVNVIMSSVKRVDGPQKMLIPNNIKEINFTNGEKTETKIVEKAKLIIPARVTNQVGLSYLIAVSSEKVIQQQFISDETAIIRIKLRVSFFIQLPSSEDPTVQLPWRIDMTIVRSINGSEAKNLKLIVGKMFTANTTPASIFTQLDLLGENTPNRKLYFYETEAEFMGEGSVRDIVRSPDVINVANMILHFSNPEHNQDITLQNEIFNVAKHLVKNTSLLQEYQTTHGLKQLLPSVVSLTRIDYRGIYPPVGYFVTEKADGKRGLAVVRGNTAFIISDKLYEFTKPAGDVSASKIIHETILDGEIIIEAAPGSGSTAPTVKFFAFDVIMVSNNNMTAIGFENRIKYLGQGVEILKTAGIDAYAKKYNVLTEDPSQIETAVKDIYEQEHKYETDGLILVAPGADYLKTVSYKWKPASHNTIDMLARKAPREVLGKAPFVEKPGHTLYFLFVGISHAMFSSLGIHWCPGYKSIFRDDGSYKRYFPIQFAPSDVPLAYLYQYPNTIVAPDGASSAAPDIGNKIIEVRCGGDCAAAGGEQPTVDWELVKIREDRNKDLLSGNYFGNNFKTAEMVWLNYIDPFPVEQLWEGVGSNYFMVRKGGAYKAQTSMTNFVKNNRILFSLNHLDWVVDIGAGKGQDIKRYIDAGVRNLIAVDRDRSAISELVRRKFQIAASSESSGRHGAKSHKGIIEQRRFSTNIRAIVADASNPHEETLAKIMAAGLPPNGANALVCNLAVHYFFGSEESIINFILLTKHVVRIGGIVVLTIIDGERVHNMLHEANIPYEGSLDMIEDGDASMTKKYSIRRLYRSNKLEKFGQKISLVLPFSNGEYYEENLVNPSHFIAEFAKRGFTCTERTGILDSMTEFETRSPLIAKLLTDSDKKWLSLYGELIFRRDK
jgi:hypothetical protein